MTNEEIIALAKVAAESAFDAHGKDHMPSAETAYDFIRQMVYEECEGSDVEARAAWDAAELTPEDWPLFRVQYVCTYHELASEVKA